MTSTPWSPVDLPRGEGHLRLEEEADWLELVLDNPSARNAVSPGMMADLAQAVARLEQDPPPVLLLRGQGTAAFCAGGDLRSVRAHLLAPGAAGGMQDYMAALVDRLAALPALLLASVEGAALGGGAELLTACDQVFAARDARVGFVHADLGVSPGWGGGRRLVRRLGTTAALRVLLPDGPPDAAAARAAGLVHVLVAPGHALSAARARALRVSALPASAVRAAVQIARTGDLAVERAAFCELWGGPDHRAALDRSGKGRR